MIYSGEYTLSCCEWFQNTFCGVILGLTLLGVTLALGVAYTINQVKSSKNEINRKNFITNRQEKLMKTFWAGLAAERPLDSSECLEGSFRRNLGVASLFMCSVDTVLRLSLPSAISWGDSLPTDLV